MIDIVITDPSDPDIRVVLVTDMINENADRFTVMQVKDLSDNEKSLNLDFGFEVTHDIDDFITRGQEDGLTIAMEARNFRKVIYQGGYNAQAIFDTYKDRVLSDGGEILDEPATLSFIELLVDQGLYENMRGAYNVNFGVKRGVDDACLKMYNLKNVEDIVNSGTGRFYIRENHRNGRAFLEKGTPANNETMRAEGARDWMTNAMEAWLSGTIEEVVPSAGSTNDPLMVINNSGDFPRFSLQISPDDELDLWVNYEEDGSSLLFLEGTTIIPSVCHIQGMTRHGGPDDRVLATYINNAEERFYTGSVVPEDPYPDFDSNEDHEFLSNNINYGASLLFANKYPSQAQRDAVWNWENDYFGILV